MGRSIPIDITRWKMIGMLVLFFDHAPHIHQSNGMLSNKNKKVLNWQRTKSCTHTDFATCSTLPYQCYCSDIAGELSALFLWRSSAILSKLYALSNFEIGRDVMCGWLCATLRVPLKCEMHVGFMVTRLKYTMTSHLILNLDSVARLLPMEHLKGHHMIQASAFYNINK